jgi:hypothetical protein
MAICLHPLALSLLHPLADNLILVYNIWQSLYVVWWYIIVQSLIFEATWLGASFTMLT